MCFRKGTGRGQGATLETTSSNLGLPVVHCSLCLQQTLPSKDAMTCKDPSPLHVGCASCIVCSHHREPSRVPESQLVQRGAELPQLSLDKT